MPCRVETPDPSVNVLANGWLLYQTLACRIWARSGFYQSGGAFGFRDQLQDANGSNPYKARISAGTSSSFCKPAIRGRRCPALVASTVGRGVRTHCSDDYLWLPLSNMPVCYRLQAIQEYWMKQFIFLKDAL